jgi:hypothetical protein
MISTFFFVVDHGSGAPDLHGHRAVVAGAAPEQLNVSP